MLLYSVLFENSGNLWLVSLQEAVEAEVGRVRIVDGAIGTQYIRNGKEIDIFVLLRQYLHHLGSGLCKAHSCSILFGVEVAILVDRALNEDERLARMCLYQLLYEVVQALLNLLLAWVGEGVEYEGISLACLQEFEELRLHLALTAETEVYEVDTEVAAHQSGIVHRRA